MLIVQGVANTIHPSIQVTIDCPLRHEDAKMPVLDLKAWPTQEQDKETRETTVRILHEHYSKEVSAKAYVNTRSALPVKTKRTIHTPEKLQQALALECGLEACRTVYGSYAVLWI